MERRTRGFFATFELYPVADEQQDELYNYFIKGFPPGSFHTAVLANDLTGAVYKSHKLNQWNDISAFVKWTFANAPEGSVGDYENVKDWIKKTPEERKKICINKGWMLTDKELTWASLEEE